MFGFVAVSSANNQYTVTSLDARENDFIFMYSVNVQHQIPMADQTLSSRLLIQVAGADDTACPSTFSPTLCFASRLSPRGYCDPPYAYEGPRSKSSPDFLRTGETEAPENANVFLPFYLLLLGSALWLALRSLSKGCPQIQLRQTIMDGVM